IIDEAYERTEMLLTENMDRLHAVAQALLIAETLDAEQFEMIFSGEVIVEEEDTLEDLQAKANKIKKNKQDRVIPNEGIQKIQEDNRDNNGEQEKNDNIEDNKEEK
ncbi:MAG: zinc metalloprotease, partial [Alkaliphilus sp.]|nr:zinc metalloprotease [Alkaliphilus sp.]